jgi:hypothetical protein
MSVICPCVLSEIYRVIDAMGAVRGSFFLVNENCVLSPLSCGLWNTTSIKAIIRTYITTQPRV